MSGINVVELGVTLDRAGSPDVVDDVTFQIAPGEVVGLVGESGSGKSTVAMALLGHARRGARIARGSVVVEDTDILKARGSSLQQIRGKTVSYVPQEPATALNPARRVGAQLQEMLARHAPELDRAEKQKTIEASLTEVQLSYAKVAKRFPHQLSGGQQQRVCIAIAFILRPSVVVLDEPTTGLDVITQAKVLQAVAELCDRHRVAALYVTHDLAVLSGLAERVMVMYAGRIVEAGNTIDLMRSPAHPYTRGLLKALPDVWSRHELVAIPGNPPPPGRRPQGCSFAPRCSYAIEACGEQEPMPVAVGALEVRCLRAAELGSTMVERPQRADAASSRTPERALLEVDDVWVSYRESVVVKGVSLELREGECTALVGESGSGKTTLSRAIVGLNRPTQGSIRLDEAELEGHARERTETARRSIQYIFQSPYSALNPRRTIGQSIATPVRRFDGLTNREAEDRVGELLERVSLSAHMASQFPDRLSGGERQRVAIARALAANPKVIICDEITSALDVSVQASIIRLLEDLQARDGLTLLFVTHNLAVVRNLAQRVAVLKDGSLVEYGSREDVLDHPENSYTRSLLEDSPSIFGSSTMKPPAGVSR